MARAAFDPKLKLGDESDGTITADVDTIRAQLSSPQPKHQMITECMNALKKILKAAAGNDTARELLELIDKVRWPFGISG